MNWQPIETCPNDGIEILLWDGAEGFVRAMWDPCYKGYWAIITDRDDRWKYWIQMPAIEIPEN